MINLLLCVIAIVLFAIASPLSFIYTVFIKERFTWKRLSGYWKQSALSWDRYGNHQYRSLLNVILIKENGYLCGDFRETISSVLGKNERDGTLTKAGVTLANFLNWIDKDHCKKSINNFK